MSFPLDNNFILTISSNLKHELGSNDNLFFKNIPPLNSSSNDETLSSVSEGNIEPLHDITTTHSSSYFNFEVPDFFNDKIPLSYQVENKMMMYNDFTCSKYHPKSQQHLTCSTSTQPIETFLSNTKHSDNTLYSNNKQNVMISSHYNNKETSLTVSNKSNDEIFSSIPFDINNNIDNDFDCNFFEEHNMFIQ
jgi:hypothetical protein